MTIIDKIKALPVLSYVRRYWWVIVALWAFYVMARADSVFAVLDIFAYLPLAFAAWVALVLLWRNIFNRKTTDHFVDTGNFAEAFNNMPREEKVKITVQQMNGYLVGGAIVVHALVSNLFGG